MPSQIDDTFPLTGQNVPKAGFRAILATAKSEISALQAALAGIGQGQSGLPQGWRSADEFGTLTSGGANPETNRATLQAAFDTCGAEGYPLYIPMGDFLISASLTVPSGGRLKVFGSYADANAGETKIRGNFPEPVVRMAGTNIWYNYDPVAKFWQYGDTPNWVIGDDTLVRTGSGGIVQFFDLCFDNDYLYGSCVQMYNIFPLSCFHRCRFSSNFAGLMILQGFNSLVSNCLFSSAHINSHPNTIADGHYLNAMGFAMPGHTSLHESSFIGWGSALRMQGNENQALGNRIEVNTLAVLLGAPVEASGNLATDPGLHGTNYPVSYSTILGLSLESNSMGIDCRSIGRGNHVFGATVTAHANATPGGGDPIWGINFANNSPIYMPRLEISGSYTQAKIVGTPLVDWGDGLVPFENGSTPFTLPEHDGSHVITTSGSATTVIVDPDAKPGSRYYVTKGAAGDVTIDAGSRDVYTHNPATGNDDKVTTPRTLRPGPTTITTLWQTVRVQIAPNGLDVLVMTL